MEVGPYRIEGELGRGAVGTVHRAIGPGGRLVAIKVLAVATLEDLDHFSRERRLQAELGANEGFVLLLDAAVHRGRPYLVMPLLSGGALRERLQRGPLPLEQALALGRALARTLGLAHARGVVHRDLKPESDRRGRVGRARHPRARAPRAR